MKAEELRLEFEEEFDVEPMYEDGEPSLEYTEWLEKKLTDGQKMMIVTDVKEDPNGGYYVEGLEI